MVQNLAARLCIDSSLETLVCVYGSQAVAASSSCSLTRDLYAVALMSLGHEEKFLPRKGNSLIGSLGHHVCMVIPGQYAVCGDAQVLGFGSFLKLLAMNVLCRLLLNSIIV